jgi:hypothetical protein
VYQAGILEMKAAAKEDWRAGLVRAAVTSGGTPVSSEAILAGGRYRAERDEISDSTEEREGFAACRFPLARSSERARTEAHRPARVRREVRILCYVKQRRLETIDG